VSTARVLRSESALWIGAATAALFLLFGNAWLGDLSRVAWSVLLFAWLFAVILWGSFAVVRHADCLAVRLGEPYGTLILTLSVISIEVVMISAVMLTGENNPTLARDTMFAVLMIVLNGMVGVAMLVGGWRHHTPAFNCQGANAYLGVLIPLALLTLVLPRFTQSAPGGQPSPLLATYLILASLVLYGVFLGVQTMRHRGFFTQPADGESAAEIDDHHDHGNLVVRSVPYHALFLLLTMVPIVLLSKSMAKLVDHGITVVGAPYALGGLLVAILVLSPEALAGFRAALHDQFQRAMNIGLGSAMATIGLTVPAVLVISYVTGKPIELGLDPVEMLILLLTLATIVVNSSSGRTNVLQGAVHLLLFVTYIVLLFD
jgi:Ca2+:H+ antiporter